MTKIRKFVCDHGKFGVTSPVWLFSPRYFLSERRTYVYILTLATNYPLLIYKNEGVVTKWQEVKLS